MPLYEYECRTCERVFEVMQKFSDSPLSTCEVCGGAVTKLMSLNSFSLKGSGWYSTDYKSKKAETSKPATPSKPESK